MSSREQRPNEAARLQATIDRLALELARERAAHRRTAEELDWAWESNRVFRRVIERLVTPKETKP